jgi:hypothetical protein
MPLSTTMQILKCFQCVVEARKNVYCRHTTRFDLEEKKCVRDSVWRVKMRATAPHVHVRFRSTVFSSPTHWHFHFAAIPRPSPFRHTQEPAHARRTTSHNDNANLNHRGGDRVPLAVARASERCERARAVSSTIQPSQS